MDVSSSSKHLTTWSSIADTTFSFELLILNTNAAMSSATAMTAITTRYEVTKRELPEQQNVRPDMNAFTKPKAIILMVNTLKELNLITM